MIHYINRVTCFGKLLLRCCDDDDDDDDDDERIRYTVVTMANSLDMNSDYRLSNPV